MKKSTQQHHYYASCAFQLGGWHWCVAESLDELMRRMARRIGAGNIKANRGGEHGGVVVATCRVELPESAHYKINNFMPVDVPVSEHQCYVIHTAAGRYSKMKGAA